MSRTQLISWRMEFINKLTQQLGITEGIDGEGKIYVFGETYDPLATPTSKEESLGDSVMNKIWPKVEENERFISDAYSKVFFTYRTQFTPILRSEDGPSPINFTVLFRDNPMNTLENVLTDPDSFHSDIGWGCMIRTGQSLLANAIQRIKLGRDFRVNLSRIDDQEMNLIRWFQDDPKYPLSLHNFVKSEGENSGMKPGEWFGPSATARSIRSLIKEFPQSGIDNCIISTQSAEIYKDEVDSIFQSNKNSTILFLFAVKLGVENINTIYWDDLFNIIASPQSVGIAGGKPSSSLYFFGYQNEYLFYLDPHKTQSSSANMNDLSFYQSCHGQKFSRIHISETDPSMLIGILIFGRDEWKKWQLSCASNQIIQFLDSKPKSDLFKEMDLSLEEESICSVNSERHDTGDYVDIGTMVSGKPSASLSQEEFENVKCKSQSILVCEDSNDPEVEHVLVEDNSSNH